MGSRSAFPTGGCKKNKAEEEEETGGVLSRLVEGMAGGGLRKQIIWRSVVSLASG